MRSFHVQYFRNDIVVRSFFNVTVNAASVFSQVKFLDCLDYFFNYVLGTFRSFYNLNEILVFHFEMLSSSTSCLQANSCLSKLKN